MTTRFLVIVMLALGASTAYAQQPPRLRVIIGQRDYVEPQHTRGGSSKAEFVFYPGDEISLQLRIVNWDSAEVLIPPQGRTAADLVTVRLFRQDEAASAEIPVRLVSSDPPSLVSPSERFSASWDERLAVRPNWYLTAPLVLEPRAQLQPGFYEMRVTEVHVTCERPCEVRNYSGLVRFEFRALDGVPEHLDQLFRLAWIRIESHEPEAALGLINRMLALHTTSSAAYQLRGRRAELLGRWSEAAEAYEHALRLVETGQDELRRQIGEPGSLRGYLRARANAARQSSRR
jgi:tetratricopeptide (TPR) repeat protein